MDPAVARERGRALIGQGDVNDVALNLFGDVGEGGGGFGKRNHFAVVGQGHDDIRVVVKLLDVALHLAGDGDVQQVIAAPVVQVAALRQRQRDLVAGGNLLDGLRVRLQLNRDIGKAHAVVAPGEDLARFVDGDHVVEAGGDLGQLAHFRRRGNVAQLFGGEGTPLVDVAVLVDADREGAAGSDHLRVALHLRGHLQHSEAGRHIGLGDILIIQIYRKEEGKHNAAQENQEEQDQAGHGYLVVDKALHDHAGRALHQLLFLLGKTAEHHALGSGSSGGFPLAEDTFLCHCLTSSQFSSRTRGSTMV